MGRQRKRFQMGQDSWTRGPQRTIEDYRHGPWITLKDHQGTTAGHHCGPGATSRDHSGTARRGNGVIPTIPCMGRRGATMVDRRSSFGPFRQSGHCERATQGHQGSIWTTAVALHGPLRWPGPGPPDHPVVHRKTCGPLTGHVVPLLVRISRKGLHCP